MSENSKKILVVDDQEHILEIVSTLLVSHGYEVMEASSYDQALEQIDTQKPDLAILDYLLPERNGGDLLAAIHAKPGFEDVPIVFLTGLAIDNADAPSQIKAFNEFYDALSKPINNDLLLRIVTEKTLSLIHISEPTRPY